MIRASASDEYAARIQQLQGAQVDFLVTARGWFDSRSTFSKRRRIKDNRVKLLSRRFELPQCVEDVRFTKLNIIEIVQFSILLRGGNRIR